MIVYFLNDFFMKISRELAIQILKYLHKNQKFYFPFLVMCKEYTPEDDDFVEIAPEEWLNIKEDDIYKTFELWENLQNLDKRTIKLMSQGFIQKILWEHLKNNIKILAKWYRRLYKNEKTDSLEILEYWENEFFWGKAEAFEEVLEMMEWVKW